MSCESRKYKEKSYLILRCPVCGKDPKRETHDEWDDWGRWIDRTLYRISCCGVETLWHVDKTLAIRQWSNIVIEANPDWLKGAE